MAWIELHEGLWDSWKLAQVCGDLGLSDVQAVGHLLSLWHFTLKNAVETGDLGKWGDAGIERAARWRGGDGLLVKAIRRAELMDGSAIHDWHDFVIHYLASLERSERTRAQIKVRVAAWREKKRIGNASGNAPVTKCNADTVPNLTVPNQPKERRGAFAPPSMDAVKAYCLERGGKVDPSRWLDYYTANGWRVGRNPMKDWKAAVRTWEKNHDNGARSGNGVGGRVVGQAAPIPGKYDEIDRGRS